MRKHLHACAHRCTHFFFMIHPNCSQRPAPACMSLAVPGLVLQHGSNTRDGARVSDSQSSRVRCAYRRTGNQTDTQREVGRGRYKQTHTHTCYFFFCLVVSTIGLSRSSQKSFQASRHWRETVTKVESECHACVCVCMRVYVVQPPLSHPCPPMFSPPVLFCLQRAGTDLMPWDIPFLTQKARVRCRSLLLPYAIMAQTQTQTQTHRQTDRQTHTHTTKKPLVLSSGCHAAGNSSGVGSPQRLCAPVLFTRQLLCRH